MYIIGPIITTFTSWARREEWLAAWAGGPRWADFGQPIPLEFPWMDSSRGPNTLANHFGITFYPAGGIRNPQLVLFGLSFTGRGG